MAALVGGWDTSGNKGYGGKGGANAYNLISSGAIGISAGTTVNCKAATLPSNFGGGTGGGFDYTPTALTGYKGGDGTRGAYGGGRWPVQLDKVLVIYIFIILKYMLMEEMQEQQQLLHVHLDQVDRGYPAAGIGGRWSWSVDGSAAANGSGGGGYIGGAYGNSTSSTNYAKAGSYTTDGGKGGSNQYGPGGGRRWPVEIQEVSL